ALRSPWHSRCSQGPGTLRDGNEGGMTATGERQRGKSSMDIHDDPESACTDARLQSAASGEQMRSEAAPSCGSGGEAPQLLTDDLGHEDSARRILEQVTANDSTDMLKDTLGLVAMAFAAEACAYLGDVPRAARLYDLLLPHARAWITWAEGSPVGP